MSGIPNEGDAYKVLGILRTPAEEPNFQALVKFLEEVRAAGYAEAIEKAVARANHLREKLAGIDAKTACELVAEDILKLAPAATTQEPK